MSNDCIFCRIAQGELPTKKVDETEHSLAFRDLDPQAPTHILVIPKAHVASLAEADDPAILGDVMYLAARVAAAEGLAESGYRTVINTGPDGGQTVSHLHVHILGGRRMAWPPG